MADLPNGLQTADYDAPGWQGIYNSDIEKLDEYMEGRQNADYALGEVAQADNPAGTAVAISMANVPGEAIINANFAEIQSEFNKLRTDVLALISSVNTLLDNLRTTGGNGVLHD